MKDRFIIAKKRFSSRLIVGTGKYKNMSECAKAIKLSGADIVTVAVRRVNISDKNKLYQALVSIEDKILKIADKYVVIIIRKAILNLLI